MTVLFVRGIETMIQGRGRDVEREEKHGVVLCPEEPTHVCDQPEKKVGTLIVPRYLYAWIFVCTQALYRQPTWPL